MPKTIPEFQGEFRFLSNFWPAEVQLDALIYPSVEHAYMAAKTTDQRHRDNIRLMRSPGDAKRYARTVPLRDGWDLMKLNIMLELLRQKFQHPDLKAKLLATGSAPLIEGNRWGDIFWGVCKGRGSNHLGRLLMQVREEIRNA